MKDKGLVDHLFRHHYGKMVSTLVRIFGFSNLELLEDAVQDTFLKAMQQWRIEMPENPEGWLTNAAKNRVLDLFRKIKAENNRALNFDAGPSVISINQMFLDDQIEDNQLRMIFTACHPALNIKDQIAFALKTVAGFNDREIASALLLKVETIKKRLARARNTIKEQNISFAIPDKKEMGSRINYVHDVVYLIFNEGFHSTRSNNLVRKELCGEAIRLCGIILKNEHLRTGEGYALMALLCFHAARLDSKLVDGNILVDLKNQDRTKWSKELIDVGRSALFKSMEYEPYSIYHYEAAIGAEHIKASSYEETNWSKILYYSRILHKENPSELSALNIVIILLQMHQHEEAFVTLKKVSHTKLESRVYLYHGTWAEYYIHVKNREEAIRCLDLALQTVTNSLERRYIEKKKEALLLG